MCCSNAESNHVLRPTTAGQLIHIQIQPHLTSAYAAVDRALMDAANEAMRPAAIARNGRHPTMTSVMSQDLMNATTKPVTNVEIWNAMLAAFSLMASCTASPSSPNSCSREPACMCVCRGSHEHTGLT